VGINHRTRHETKYKTKQNETKHNETKRNETKKKRNEKKKKNETKQNETKRNKIKRNETKQNKKKRNKIKRNETKQNETKRNKIKRNKMKQNEMKQQYKNKAVKPTSLAARTCPMTHTEETPGIFSKSSTINTPFLGSEYEKEIGKKKKRKKLLARHTGLRALCAAETIIEKYIRK
jgi:hypothetical protein